MKKIFLALIAAAFTLASCDMDKSPEGSTTDTDALTGFTEMQEYRKYCKELAKQLTKTKWERFIYQLQHSKAENLIKYLNTYPIYLIFL